MQKNGGAEEQRQMKKTWGIRERLFRDDYRRRMKIFDLLMSSIAL